MTFSMSTHMLTLLQSNLGVTSPGPSLQRQTMSHPQQLRVVSPEVRSQQRLASNTLAQQEALRALLQPAEQKTVPRDKMHIPEHFEFSPELMAALARALDRGQPSSSQPQVPARKYFSKTITNATSDLPTSVIKELKAGFKNYIPLALCMHKACLTATRTTDPFDSEFGLADDGKIRWKQKSMTPAKDHYITTDDLTEIRENFVRGIRRYLVMGEDTEPGGERASACADMFLEFFSIIAARPDYTLDWPAYRGYIIESYTSWVGRRDDSYGLIFDEALFFKYKVTNLVPLVVDQLRQPGPSAGARGGAGARGRGRGGSARGGSPAPSFPPSLQSQQSTSTFRCFLCGGNHQHKDHQGPPTRLVANDNGKWIDKALGPKLVCISFNIGFAGCKRGAACTYQHSCSLCGDSAHGATKCGA